VFACQLLVTHFKALPGISGEKGSGSRGSISFSLDVKKGIDVLHIFWEIVFTIWGDSRCEQ